MRPCPYCGKEIQDEAIVCRYCGLDVERPDWLRDKHRCPYCAEWIGRSLTLCPYCKSDLGDEATLFEIDSELPEPSPVQPPAAPPEPPVDEEPEEEPAPEPAMAAEEEAEPLVDEDSFSDEIGDLRPTESPYYSSDWAGPPRSEEPMRAVPLDKSGKPKDAKPVRRLQIDWGRFRRPALIGGLTIVVLALGVSGAYAFRAILPAALAASETPSPAPTKRPTSSPTAPSATQPSSTQATAVAAGGCVTWDQVSLQDARKTMCVYGVVKRWFAAGDLPFVAIFSEAPGTFALVDRSQSHPEVRPGECIRGEGEIEVMSATRPFIDINGTVLPCP